MDPMTLIGAHATLMAATRSGLLDILGDEPLRCEQCAQRLGLNQRALQHVLEVLAELGILSRHGDAYQLSKQKTPTRGLNSSWDTLLILQQQFDHLGVMLKSGKPLSFMDTSAAQREASYRSLVCDMGVAFAETATSLARQLNIQPLRVLDVGCGSGVWSLAIAAEHPQTQVTGLDLPMVLDAFLNRAKALNLDKRSTLLPGDMHQVEIPAAHYDLAIIANVLRLEPPEKARQLVTRIASSVRPGGALLVVDALAGGTPAKEQQRAVYALHLALRTEAGRVHSPKDISAWMSDAGFGNLKMVDLDPNMAAVGALIGWC